MKKLLDVWVKSVAFVERIEFLGPLLMRLCIGVLFAQSGWGKLHNLDRTTQFFASLHIPAPHAQAVFVSLVELIGGVCVVVGLGTRVASLMLAGTMAVALLTAVEFEGLLGFLTTSETIYLVALIGLVLRGAGVASLDALVARRLKV